MRVLVLTPSLSLPGGVANHYLGLLPYWSNDVKYVTCGRRKNMPAYITLLPDWLKFLFYIITFRPQVVIVNPSFSPQPLFRDGVNILLAKMCLRKVVTFIHGFDLDFYDRVKNNQRMFCWVYNKNSMIYVLYSDFKNKLEQIGIKSKIKLTTTKVDNSLVENVANYNTSSNNEILFLARAENEKGLDVTMRVFKILKERQLECRLIVCGDGSALKEAQSFAKDNLLNDVDFTGFVSGDERIKYFNRSQIYILPTTHGEGMATSVLEAMAMGLVVITRPVGGVNDFFERGKMGYLVESLEPEDYANIIEELYNNPEKIKEISAYNRVYACEHFLASNVAKSIENDLLTIV